MQLRPDDTFISACARTAVASGLLLLAACAGAGAGATRPGPASVAGGKFSATGAGAPNYGGAAPRACPPTAIARYVATDSADHARDARKPAPQADGRLCAIAETLLGWDEQQPVPESVRSFLAFHFGLPSTIPGIVVATIEGVENPKDLAARLEEVLTKYVATTAGPVRYGIANAPGSRGGTKVALAMQDPPLEVDGFPRKLDPKTDATLSGRLLGGAQNAKVLVSDPRGKLEQPASKPGQQFSAPVGCGGRTGRMAIEIRAEDQGQARVVTNFPVYCGIDPPATVQLPAPAGDVAQQERAVFDQINAERTEAQLPPLKWDDKVARVARSLAEAESKGSTGSKEEIAAKLKEAGIASPSVLINPGAARTAEDTQRLFSLSPVYRANYMTTEATTAGVGVANAKDAQGATVAYVSELFLRELAQVDVGKAAPSLRETINKRRTASRMPAFADDATLDKIAQEYAQALAAGNGNITDAKHSQIVSPLYKTFRTVDFISGAKADPLEFADEKTVMTSKEKAMGIGLAQGAHPQLGKNATYVVLLFGTRK